MTFNKVSTDQYIPINEAIVRIIHLLNESYEELLAAQRGIDKCI